jgi:transposase
VIPDDLPAVVEVHDLRADQKACASCGQDMTLIGVDESTKLAYTPAKLHKLVHRQMKYACSCAHCAEKGAGVRTAERPREPIPGCLADASLLAHVVVAKTQDHLPHFRIEDQLSRLGCPVSRATLANWYLGSAEALVPLYRELKSSVLACPIVHHDDTPVKELEPGKGRCRTSRIWVAARGLAPWHVVFDYTPTRSQDGPRTFLAGYRGYLVADAYSAYDGLYAPGEIEEVGCWAHTRRGFHDALKSGESEAIRALALIRALYAVEREAGEANLDASARQALRGARSAPLLSSLQDLFTAWKGSGRLLPKSPLGQAVQYAENQWVALNRFLADGRLPMDNNRAENLIRPFALGRKNWLFFGNARGGRAAAILHSLVVTCRINQVNPFAYLEDVLRRIMDHNQQRLDELLPDRWQAARPAAVGNAVA